MIIIHDCRLPKAYKDALIGKLPEAVFVPFMADNKCKDPPVYDSILHHPDIYFFKLDNETIIHAPGLTDTCLSPLKEAGMELIPGAADPCGTYPDTARYNAVCIGGMVLHDLSCSDPVIIETAKKRGYKLIGVPQGYTRCSAVTVGENAIITSDEGIAGSGRNAGIDIFQIPPGSVLLPGEERGFLGGASGNPGSDTSISGRP